MRPRWRRIGWRVFLAGAWILFALAALAWGRSEFVSDQWRRLDVWEDGGLCTRYGRVFTSPGCVSFQWYWQTRSDPEFAGDRSRWPAPRREYEVFRVRDHSTWRVVLDLFNPGSTWYLSESRSDGANSVETRFIRLPFWIGFVPVGAVCGVRGVRKWREWRKGRGLKGEARAFFTGP
jgi:hypothetical protein